MGLPFRESFAEIQFYRMYGGKQKLQCMSWQLEPARCQYLALRTMAGLFPHHSDHLGFGTRRRERPVKISLKGVLSSLIIFKSQNYFQTVQTDASREAWTGIVL
jgi:hypothetical protein